MTDERDPNDSVLALIERVKARDAAGWASYGRPLNPWDGRNTAEDALEEAIDLAMYQMKAIQERRDLAAWIGEMAEWLEREWMGRGESSLAEEAREWVTRLTADIPRIGKSEAELERETWERVKGPGERLAEMMDYAANHPGDWSKPMTQEVTRAES